MGFGPKWGHVATVCPSWQQIPEDVKELARALHRAELQSTSPGQDAIIEHLGAMARGGGDAGAPKVMTSSMTSNSVIKLGH